MVKRREKRARVLYSITWLALNRMDRLLIELIIKLFIRNT